MKKNYFFMQCFVIYIQSFGQTCSDAESDLNYAYEGHKIISNLPNSKSFEDGRFYVKRAREIAQKAINELEICSK